jgi:PAS domain S-box-containing protein
MNADNYRFQEVIELRKQAEIIATQKFPRLQENPAVPSLEETRRMLHELQVHQIELEMQNVELRRAQVELDATRARYFDLYDLAPVGYVTISEKGLILEANLTAATLLSVARGKLIRQPFSSFIIPEGQDAYYLHRKQCLESGEPKACELRMVKKDGSKFWAGLEMTTTLDTNSAPVCRIVMIDNTERKRIEEARKQSDEKYRSMMEAMDDAAYICSPDFRIEYQNAAMIKRIGRDASGERCYTEIHGQEEKCPWCIHEKVMRGEFVKTDVTNSKSGKSYSVSNSPIYHPDGTISKLSIFRDVTEIKNMAAQLAKAQRMEAIGALAGGIAHDFNNILYPIIGFSEILMEDLRAGSPDHEHVGVIYEAAKRAGALVKQILSFSRQIKHEKQPMRIQHILKEVLNLTRSTIPSNIEISQSIQSDCSLVMADPAQLHQIAMNLITNAFHAVESSGGSIFVQLKESVLAGKEWAGVTLEPGKYAVLTVSDTGHGIDPEVMEKIFEPYFTTKEVGKGTGLGLSVVNGIVLDHGGEIRVYSEEGKGATFSVYLPAIDTRTETLSAEEAMTYETGVENILLVDDEEPIVQIEKQMLDRLGYHVEAYSSSIEALKVFRANPGGFDLVITDMTMPYMTGDKLAGKLRSIKPGVPIIICTGFSTKINDKKSKLIGIDGYLPKPVLKSEMAKMIRRVLEKPNVTN